LYRRGAALGELAPAIVFDGRNVRILVKLATCNARFCHLDWWGSGHLEQVLPAWRCLILFFCAFLSWRFFGSACASFLSENKIKLMELAGILISPVRDSLTSFQRKLVRPWRGLTPLGTKAF
jgi:hypothetical protein